MSKSRRSFTAQFKREAVQMIRQQGLSVAESAWRLDVHANVLRKWQRELEAQGEQAFPGKGQQSALEEENRRLREENARLKMERDI
ncbi:MAG: transposase [Planctomycetaceae bacterium]|nr:transposase [Planctomycetaceae bacterium]